MIKHAIVTRDDRLDLCNVLDEWYTYADLEIVSIHYSTCISPNSKFWYSALIQYKSRSDKPAGQ